MHWRQLHPVREVAIVAGYAAEILANSRVVCFKQLVGRNIEGLHLAEKPWKRGEFPALAQHQRTDLSLQPAWISSDAAGPLHLHPFGVAEIRGQHEDDVFALIDCTFEGPDPVVSPANRFDVKEARNAVARQPAMKFSNEIFILAAVTEEDTISSIGHRPMLSQKLRAVAWVCCVIRPGDGYERTLCRRYHHFLHWGRGH